MSTQDVRKLTEVLRSIELIEEKINAIHSRSCGENPVENRSLLPISIDDSNVDLQIFFKNFEQLLLTDLKNRKSLLSMNGPEKPNYWSFFAAALRGSKGLYDTIVYVQNSSEVKTSIGRGRLFIRFCLQNHRLGDVVQQSFMLLKSVYQYYVDECFWANPTYLTRIVQALYQLNDVKFDLLSSSQYQLDVDWPTIETREVHPKSSFEFGSPMKTERTSSFLSMSSADSQSVVSVVPEASTSISIGRSPFRNFDASINDESSAQSLSSADEDPENTLAYWKEKYQFLENQRLQSLQKKEVQVQCSLQEIEPIGVEENQELKQQINELKLQIDQLNTQISNFSSQDSDSADKLKDHEQKINQCQSLIKAKDQLIEQLKRELAETAENLQTIQNQFSTQSKTTESQIEFLQLELEKTSKTWENERERMEKERDEFRAVQERLEFSLQEKTLDFEEMKRRLIKAVREKADLFNAVHNYEIKLEQEQSKKWAADEEVSNCTKCNATFGWTLRKHHCRHCQKIFCYYCSNNWIAGDRPNSPQRRICDFCSDELLKESLMPKGTPNSVNSNETLETADDLDLRFEVRPERLANTTIEDTNSTNSS